MPMQSLLGANHRLPVFRMAKSFIWLEETKKRMNEFSIGYMINKTLNIKKLLREQVNKFTKTTLEKNKTRVLELLIFYEKK